MDKIILFLKDKEGTTAIEYALIASLIFLAIVSAVSLLGGKVENLLYLNIMNAIKGALS